MAWSDDVSGNVSKQYNPHTNLYIQNLNLPHEKLSQEYFVRFCSTSSYASSSEQFVALTHDFHANVDISKKDVWHEAYNCHHEEEIIFQIIPHVLPADNPQQSEHASHVGGNGLNNCRCDTWGGIMMKRRQMKGWSKNQEVVFATRLQAADLSGLTTPPPSANYLVQYKNSLIGKHFKILQQLTVFQVHGLCSDKIFDLWKAAGELGVMMWIPEIDNMDQYRIFSNHLAPSKDIASTLADMERFKYIVSRGWWMESGGTSGWSIDSPTLYNKPRNSATAWMDSAMWVFAKRSNGAVACGRISRILLQEGLTKDVHVILEESSVSNVSVTTCLMGSQLKVEIPVHVHRV
ncbi:hypothetical protein FA15DRAFT_661542 [Coprinopsis marcescibilis]|uniref:Uncharacterized protein n=1 Tax=Coprinopsis marcescibilis TaxID=230819 RepID=A0A5C3KBK2_COPMA|nr:hypothetical protein FA15DRAFT_661542 [Coprinopsis marcescibilis]